MEAQSETPKVSVIIVTWNQEHYTTPCVHSVLANNTEVPYEIIIVDNGSMEGSVQKYREEFGENPLVKILVLPHNKGYTGGNNAGVRIARGEYVVILNNDTLVEPDWLNHLVAAIESDDQIGAVNAYEIREGCAVNPQVLATKKIRLNMLQYGVVLDREEPLSNVDLVDSIGIKGACFIYRKNLVEVPFDEDYFIYAEDIKLCWILRCRGYKIKSSTKAVYHHYHNITRKESKSFNKKAVYLGERNMLMNLLTFYSLPHTLAMLPLIALRSIAYNVVNPRELPYRLKAYAYLVWNLPLIFKKRGEIKQLKTVPEEELFKEMTWKLFPRSCANYKIQVSNAKPIPEYYLKEQK